MNEFVKSAIESVIQPWRAHMHHRYPPVDREPILRNRFEAVGEETQRQKGEQTILHTGTVFVGDFDHNSGMWNAIRTATGWACDTWGEVDVFLPENFVEDRGDTIRVTIVVFES